MDNDYGYANARLRAMKSRLLPPSAYNELLDQPTVEEVVASLNRTVYQPAIEKALIKSSGWACLSEALRTQLGQTMDKIAKFFRGDSERLWRALVGRWQAFNVKTILRGQANHVPAAEVLNALVPAGDLQESDFTRLVQQTSVRAAVDLLATWHYPFARSLRDAMPRYVETGDLAELEMALDRARYDIAFRQVSRVDDESAEQVIRVLRREVDATNILTLVRLAAAGISGVRFAQRYGTSSPSAVLVPGGGLATERLMEYKEIPTIEQLGRDLRATKFSEALARAEAIYAEKHSLAAFEDEIEGQMVRERYGLFRHDPLSMGIAIAYLTALVNEVRNLRIIGRGKAAGWKREEIEKELRLWPS